MNNAKKRTWNEVTKKLTRRSLSDGFPAKQLAFILFIATSEPFHFP